MLSVVVVGRNDTHGYNLSKRVATSLNSLAEPMTNSDELIFVDWNSEDCNPTFAEAILDTLTEKTMAHLVIYRVRNSTHLMLSSGTNRPILEPIARNVGISRAKNHWVLSTNTDMILNTHNRNYSDLLKNLDDNLYHLFRFEIPEYIWDQFDRKLPRRNLELLDKMSGEFLPRNRIVTSPFEGYKNKFPDAVGDFQLATKKIWDSVKGFPEDMLKGWHVDSRASVAIEVKNQISAQILPSELIEGFHQNHLRSITHFHNTTEMNSLSLVGQGYSNLDTWGLQNYEIENVRVKDFLFVKNNIWALSTKIKDRMPQSLDVILSSFTYDKDLVKIFLSDEIINLPNKSKVIVKSFDSALIDGLRSVYANILKNSKEIFFIDYRDKNDLQDSSLFIIDFGIQSDNWIDSDVRWNKSKFVAHLKSNFKILQELPNNKRIAIVRGNHWAIRGLVQENCNVPLFNNYSSVLSGTTKLRRIRFSKFKPNFINQLRQYALITLTDLAKDAQQKDDFFINLNMIYKIIFNTYYRFPYKFRSLINPFLRKLLKAY